MIRPFNMSELELVMEIWLEANSKAHDFIQAGYWQENYDLVKEMLPDATIFVSVHNDQIKGFIGLMGDYIAGIFVDTNSQSQGIGKALLDHVKKNHAKLSLHVYKKNVRAVRFYLREGFVVLEEQIDDKTGETELVMSFEA